LLVQALSGMGEVPNLLLVSVGSGKPSVDVNIQHLRLGHVGNDRLLSQIYSAADVFVIPSLQEAFGQTALEAMACGTPVIGFAVGGIPDMVRPGVTGFLVPAGDTTSLRDAIRDLLEAPGRRAEMATYCRHIAVKEYALEVQAQRYKELYETILSSR
jgi:glycosyltransferase involved in cell wall biosynthesis